MSEKSLEGLKARMTPEQKKDMAELIQKELIRRQELKQAGGTEMASSMESKVRGNRLSSSLNHDQVKELYGDVSSAVKSLRQQKIDGELSRIAEVRGSQSQRGNLVMPRIPRALVSRNTLLVGGIILLGAAKIIFSTGVVDASVTSRSGGEVVAMNEMSSEITPRARESLAEPQFRKTQWSEPEKKILVQLDARRVELETRKGLLDRREAEIQSQMDAMNERLAELKSLTSKLRQQRKEKDVRHEARLEQLANVYGSMAPAEAAPLISKLDTETALALLKRLPGKRLGQVLSQMPSDTAIELTKLLADKNKEHYGE